MKVPAWKKVSLSIFRNFCVIKKIQLKRSTNDNKSILNAIKIGMEASLGKGLGTRSSSRASESWMELKHILCCSGTAENRLKPIDLTDMD